MPQLTGPNMYRRNLPHFQPMNGCFFITTILEGSLPKGKINEFAELRNQQEKELREKITNVDELKHALIQLQEAYFHQFNALLDFPDSGPTWFKYPQLADVIEESIHYLGEKECRIIAYCIMANHVHLILDQPGRVLFRIMQSFKRHTARHCNIILGRTGMTFWHDESFDYLIRNEGDLRRRIDYVLQNPVKVKLVNQWQEWPYSFLHPDFGEL